MEVQARILEDIAELEETIEKQIERLDDLKLKRNSNPGTLCHPLEAGESLKCSLDLEQYYCLFDPSSAIDNVELQPDGASDAGTAFTRYTVAQSTVATTSRLTS